MRNKKIGMLILAVIASMFLMSCGESPEADSVLSDGAAAFAEGKTEKDIALVSSEQVLNNLIADYSGSRSDPQGVQMSDDDVQKIIDTSDDTTGDPSADDSSVNAPSVISSKADLKQALHAMFDETQESAVFEFTGGYMIDLDMLYEAFLEVEREDPFDVICVETYGYGNVGNTVTLQFTYTMSVDELKVMKEETRTYLEEAKSEIDVTGLSQYEIVCAVNDYLCDLILYPPQEPYAAETHTAHSAFESGSAVCDGYSRAAKMLLNEFGVECDFVVGTCTDGGGHAWNLVKLDGNWYHMDVTWNDGGAEWDANARSQYLLVTDEFMLQSRTWDSNVYPATPVTSYY